MENHRTVLTIAEPLYGSRRLNALIASGKVDPTKTLFLDCYNQQTYEILAPTITARISASNHYFISEQTMSTSHPPKIKLLGNVYGTNTHGGRGGDIFDVEGISRTLSAAPGGTADTFILIPDPAILRQERTEQEKRRRSLEGDSGAKFSASKTYAPRPDGISNTITQSPKDNMLIETIRND